MKRFFLSMSAIFFISSGLWAKILPAPSGDIGPEKISWSKVREDWSGILLKRAKEPVSMPDTLDDWDRVANVATELRARSLFLQENKNLGSEDSAAILASCRTLVETILAWEASGERVKQSGFLKDLGARGWGISKPGSMMGVSANNIVELYLTSTTLLALSETLPLTSRMDEAFRIKVMTVMSEVIDYWSRTYLEESPAYGPYFLKYGMPGDRIRELLVFNTSAQMGASLWLLAKELKTSPLASKAAAYEALSIRLGKQIKLGVLDEIRRDGGVDVDRWVYGLDKAKTSPVPQRGEDANHGSYILDLIRYFVRDQVVDAGKPIFQNADLAFFRKILRDKVWVHDESGQIAYKIYYQEGDVQKKGVKAREVIAEYATSEKSGWAGTVGWNRNIGTKDRAVDTGLSLRTSWGWVHACRGDNEMMYHLYRYYAAYDQNTKGEKIADNFFLTLVTFWAALAP